MMCARYVCYLCLCLVEFLYAWVSCKIWKLRTQEIIVEWTSYYIWSGTYFSNQTGHPCDAKPAKYKMINKGHIFPHKPSIMKCSTNEGFMIQICQSLKLPINGRFICYKNDFLPKILVRTIGGPFNNPTIYQVIYPPACVAANIPRLF